MDERRKFLKNRGGLLKSNQTPQTTTQNPQSHSNPFYQALSNNIESKTEIQKTPEQSIPFQTPISNNNNSQIHSKSGKNYQFSYTERDLEELNSSPDNVRFTSSRFPSLEMSKSIRMPIGCHVRPWYNTKESISMVDFFQLYREKTGKEPEKKFDIPRCSNCRSYVNPFFEFLNFGRQMQCNLCLLVQSVPAYYVAPLNDEGKRVDLHER